MSIKAVIATFIAIATSALVVSIENEVLAQQGQYQVASTQTAQKTAWTMPSATTPAPPVAPAPAPTYYQPAPVYQPPGQSQNVQGYWSAPPARPMPAAPNPMGRAERPVPPKAKTPSEFHLDIGGGTEAPISVGGIVTAELPHRFLMQLGVGVMPRAYSEAIDGFLTSVGAYDANTSQVVRTSLNNALVIRSAIGGRPFQSNGFEIFVGYTFMKGGGNLETADIVSAILAEGGIAVQAPVGLEAGIPISATLHNLHASIGYRWLLADERFVIRASLSYIQTVASNIHVDIPESAAVLVPYEATINEQVNEAVGPFFSKYAKAPTLGLSAAFRF